MRQALFFIGTTAEFIKLAPIIKELKKRKVFFKIITSGQNIVRFHELRYFTGKISPYYAFRQRPLGIRVPLMVGFVIWTMKAMLNYILYFRHELYGRSKQDTYFIVHGDTVSSLLGALIARMFRATLVHVESGLRSFNFLEPFPEEICRFIVSKLAHIHFCPNAWCARNLNSVGGKKINTRQNTLIETFWSAMKIKKNSLALKRIRKTNKKYFVLVVHRQEHVLFGKADTESVLEFLLKNVSPNLTCIFMVHDLSAPFVNRLRKRVDRVFSHKVIFTKLLPYGDFMHLLAQSEFVVTDGGSNQEELYYLGKPCLLIRNRTERIEGLGANAVLSGGKKPVIQHFIKNYRKYIRPSVHVGVPPSKIISDYLEKAVRACLKTHH